jgi:acyl carrier protein
VSDGTRAGPARPVIVRATVLAHVIQTIERLMGDWELEGEIGEDSLLLGDIGLESIDAVALATEIAETYGRELPFDRFLSARLDQEEMAYLQWKDFTVGELVDFVTTELNAQERQAPA